MPENPTEMAIRLIRRDAWQEAHDDICDYGPFVPGVPGGCTVHVNPYVEVN